MLRRIIFFLLFPVVCQASAYREGFLETNYTHTIAHLHGNPYEIGYQHGKLLKDKVQRNLTRFVSDEALERNPNQERLQSYISQMSQVLDHIPSALLMEMMGVADGAQVPFQKVLLLNLFPEMFHCAGFVVGPSLMHLNRMFHVRVLDYAYGMMLEDTAVMMVIKPDNGVPFVSVSYAGFVGVVSGMNMQKISIGEIGGQGYGDWDGMPMSLMLRQVLQYAKSLEEATEIFAMFKRTCEYYYVVTDGKTNKSAGYYATPNQLQLIYPGTNYAIFAPNKEDIDNKRDKYVHSNYTVNTTSHQTLFYDANNKLIALSNQQIDNCLILTGFSKPERFQLLTDDLLNKMGDIKLMDLVLFLRAPFCSSDNLHNVIFSPSTLEFWVAHASSGLAACDQSYLNYHLDDLFEKMRNRL